MARPVQRKANKDYPQNGIKKGDTYWYVKIKQQRGGIVKRSLTPFKRSQLTTSDFLGQLYDWEDQKSALSDMEGAQELADTIRSLGEEQQEKFDNMPEGLQQGDTGQMIEARSQGCEAAASEIEEIVSEWETAKEEHDDAVQAFEAAQSALEEAENGDEAEDAATELMQVEEPEEWDDSEFVSRVQDVSVDV